MPNFRKIIIDMFTEMCSTSSAKEILDAVHSAADIKDEFDASHALIAAARRNKPEVLSALIAAGMNVNTQMYDGLAPLMVAARRNSPEAVSVLIRAGADVNHARTDGLTALMGAARSNTPDVVRLLIGAGANVNAKDSNGMTALHYAAMDNPDPEIFSVLIDAGAEDVLNNSGRNALILAAMLNTAEVVTALLEACSDVHAKDVFGKTAFDHARDNPKLEGTSALLRLETMTRERG